MRIALVSRELHPFGGGGIGVQVAGAAAALADRAEVTVVTSSRHEREHARLATAGRDPLGPGVRLAFVEEPRDGECGSYYGPFHLYSARVWEALRRLYPDGGPDVVEFADFMAEGLVTVQASRARDPLLGDTSVCVRLHTTAEMCSVLNGHLDDAWATKMVVAGERYALANADRLIAPCAEVAETYRRFYGDELAGHAELAEIAPAVAPAVAGAPAPVPPLDPVRFLYLGRLERRKGVQELVRAFTAIAGERWRLTLVGGDTRTAPLGASMRDALELAAGDDPRIELHDPLARDRLAGEIDRHHVVVVPSLWECWPSAALEALARNRPVLATPVGGLPALTADGAGWLAAGRDADALTDAAERLIADPREVAAAIEARAPLRAFERHTDPNRLAAGYAALAGAAAGADDDLAIRRRRRLRPDRRPARRPVVSVVIPYFALDRFVEDAVASVADQTYEPIETIVVNDGSWRPQDAVLDRIAERFSVRMISQPNSGLSRARNTGIAQARGDYVLPLDADNMLRPTFVQRCVELLETEGGAAFATTWSQWVDESGQPLDAPSQGIQPIGNCSAAVLDDNIAGDATALLRRELFDAGFGYCPDLASYEDWQLYRQLHLAGRAGLVIPERLFVYRLRDHSMVREVGLVNHGRIYGEMRADTRAREVTWEARA